MSRGTTSYWWTCPRCMSRMEQSTRISDVERDQTAHRAESHPGVTWAPWELGISHWTEGAR